jgi:hypothetical protein
MTVVGARNSLPQVLGQLGAMGSLQRAPCPGATGPISQQMLSCLPRCHSRRRGLAMHTPGIVPFRAKIIGLQRSAFKRTGDLPFF